MYDSFYLWLSFWPYLMPFDMFGKIIQTEISEGAFNRNMKQSI